MKSESSYQKLQNLKEKRNVTNKGTENVKSPPGKRRKPLSQSQQENDSNGVKQTRLGYNLTLNNYYIPKVKPVSK